MEMIHLFQRIKQRDIVSAFHIPIGCGKPAVKIISALEDSIFFSYFKHASEKGKQNSMKKTSYFSNEGITVKQNPYLTLWKSNIITVWDSQLNLKATIKLEIFLMNLMEQNWCIFSPIPTSNCPQSISSFFIWKNFFSF